jgi:hypothetical protein
MKASASTPADARHLGTADYDSGAANSRIFVISDEAGFGAGTA